MPARKGLLAPQNNFLDTIATRFDGTHSNFVLGNAQVPSLYPIVYCSDGFCELTGYARAQIMQRGCACAFLYGEDTTEAQKKAIEQALIDKTELKLEVMFYRRNGVPFWCLLDIVPIKNEKHEVVLYLASHKDITKSKLAEQQDLENGSGVKSVNGTGSSGSGDDPDDDDDDDDESSAKKAINAQYQRRRSRAVLYQLSGHYRKSVSMKGKLKNNILHSSSLPEYKAATIKKPFYVVSHYGVFKTCWDWLILIATFYVAIAVPYSVAFRDKQDTPITIYSDVLVEIIFIIDILINFRTTFVNKKGEVVTNSKSIIKHYLQEWFFCDLLAGLPFDLLYALNLYTRNTLIHLLKLTRLVRLARLYAKMDRYSQYSYIILILLMLVFTLLAHWFACIWYIIAAEELTSHPDWDFGWIRQLSTKVGYDVHNESDTTSSYITALYFTTSSLTSVGFGNVSANTNFEKIFSVVVMLIGALMHAVVFGNVTAIIQRMYARRSQYQTKLRDLKDFFRLHQIPKQLKQRMTEFFQTTWSLNHGIDANEILKEFPDELRGDVSLHMHREMLSLPIFETAPQGCLKLLSRHIRSNFCAPEEYLVHDGDALNYIYLVCNGSMEVLQNQMVVAILGKGDLVGCNIPFSLTSESLIKSTGDVKALTYCDLKSILISGLLEVLRLYPEFAETFCNEIIHDLTFNLREGFDCDDYESSIYGYGGNLANRDEDDDEDELDDINDNDDDNGNNDGYNDKGQNQVEKLNEDNDFDENEKNSFVNKNQTSTKNNMKKSNQNNTALDQEDSEKNFVEIHKKMSFSQEQVNFSCDSSLTCTRRRQSLTKSLNKNGLNKIGSISSLNENCLNVSGRRISSADHFDHLSNNGTKLSGQLKLVDDDNLTNEDDEEDNSIASCPPASIQHSTNKLVVLSKLKNKNQLDLSNSNRRPKTNNTSLDETNLQNNDLQKKKYLHFSDKPNQLPPAFRQRKTVGYNLLSGGVNSQERYINRSYVTSGYRQAINQAPKKSTLRFLQQLNSSGSSAGSPIFNSFAERRRAQFTTRNANNARRNSGTSLHSIIFDHDSVTAAVAAVHENTTVSLERMDNQLHGLEDEIWRLSTDIKLSLNLLKQVCDLATSAVNFSNTTNINENEGTEKKSCDCNDKLLNNLKKISNSIELNSQKVSSIHSSAKSSLNQNNSRQAGILKTSKLRSLNSNSSQSLTEIIKNEPNKFLRKNISPSNHYIKIDKKLAKFNSQSTLSLPTTNTQLIKNDTKSNNNVVRFSKLATINQKKVIDSDDLKDKNLNTIDSSLIKLKPSNIDSYKLQSSNQDKSTSEKNSFSPLNVVNLIDAEGEENIKTCFNQDKKKQDKNTLKNAHHSWNSLSQFIDTNTNEKNMKNKQKSCSNEQFDNNSKNVTSTSSIYENDKNDNLGIIRNSNLNAHEITLIDSFDILSNSTIKAFDNKDQTTFDPCSTVSCSIEIEPAEDFNSDSKKDSTGLITVKKNENP